VSEAAAVWVDIADLKPWASNPRDNSKAIAEVAKSIRRFGWGSPIVANKRDGEIIAGHTRFAAAQRLKLDKVPVRWLDLDPADAHALALADNKVGEVATWDDATLRQVLQELQDADASLLADTGFSDEELAALMGEVQPTVLEPEGEPPEVDEAGPVYSVLGEVYQLGPHRLMCGDSTSVDSVDTLMSGDVADVIVFDPPYEIETLYADAMMPPLPHQKLLIFWDIKRFATAPASALSAGWTPCYELIWDNVTSWYTPNRPLARHKSCGVFGADPSWDFDAAIIHDGKKRESRTVHNTRGTSDYVPLDGAVHLRTVESFPTTAESSEHAHSKPMAWIVAMFNGVGGAIYLDLFGGSGTTLIACAQTGRSARVIELDPRYCDVIRRRWTRWAKANNVDAGTGALDG